MRFLEKYALYIQKKHFLCMGNMKKYYIIVKEAFQYVGILLLSLFAALWMIICGKRQR